MSAQYLADLQTLVGKREAVLSQARQSKVMGRTYWELGCQYVLGGDRPDDRERGIYLLIRAVELGFWEEPSSSLKSLLDGAYYPLHYLHNAVGGAESSAFQAGVAFTQGGELPYDPYKAVHWMSIGAEYFTKKGYTGTAHSLGKFYADGTCIPPDPVQADYWFTRYLKRVPAYPVLPRRPPDDCGEGAEEIALRYYSGNGVAKNLRKARAWRRIALVVNGANAGFFLLVGFLLLGALPLFLGGGIAYLGDWLHLHWLWHISEVAYAASFFLSAVWLVEYATNYSPDLNRFVGIAGVGIFLLLGISYVLFWGLLVFLLFPSSFLDSVHPEWLRRILSGL